MEAIKEKAIPEMPVDLSEDPYKMPALSGEEVEGLKDRSFMILSSRNVTFPDKKDPSKNYVKLCFKVKLADGSTADFYPNPSVLKVIIAKRGRIEKSWIGFKGKFNVYVKEVFGVQKKCIGIE